MWLVERLPVWRVREALAQSMPDGYRLLDVHDVWLGEAALPGQVAASVYRATFEASTVDGATLGRACREMLAAPTLPRERPKGQTMVRYDLRPFLERLDVDDRGPSLRMTLRHDPERGIGRPEEVLAALGERLDVPIVAVSLVREGLVLAPPPPPAPAAARAGQRGRPRSPATTPVRRS